MFKQLTPLEISNLSDGSEIFWIKRVYIWEDTFKTVYKKGQKVQKRIKDGRLKSIKYEPYRCKLVKNHHMTVSGPATCLVADPNTEYPYMVPWAGDWIYAMNSGDSYMAVRKEIHEE